MISLKSQLVKLGVAAILLLALTLLLDNLGFAENVLADGIYGIYAYMTVISVMLSVAAVLVMQKTEQATWTSLFMGMMVARLLLTAGYVGIMFYLGVENRLVWVINLFVVYLFYMVFEIVGLITNLRAISQEAE